MHSKMKRHLRDAFHIYISKFRRTGTKWGACANKNHSLLTVASDCQINSIKRSMKRRWQRWRFDESPELTVGSSLADFYPIADIFIRNQSTISVTCIRLIPVWLECAMLCTVALSFRCDVDQSILAMQVN